LGPEYASAAEGLSYQAAPRSKIFRRDAGAVTDLASLKHLMRYNGFPNDPLSGGSPFGAICSRGDLAEKPAPVGCYDTKVRRLPSTPLSSCCILRHDIYIELAKSFKCTACYTLFWIT
jgi:hypothetical protein